MKHLRFKSTKQDWLTDLINEIPLDTADYEYPVNKTLPRLRVREIQALLDALQLSKRNGMKPLGRA